MSGLSKEFQPLAKFYHYGAHVTRLLTSKGIGSAEFKKEALELCRKLNNHYTVK